MTSHPPNELAVIDAETGELLPAQSVTLFGADNPREVIRRAKEHADALVEVVNERKLYTVIQGKKYPHVEAWTLLGAQVGVFPVLDGEVEPVEIDGVHGFRATIKCVTRQGEVVGRASAYCMRDENTWKSRSHHALAGQAETRATSRALRKPLGFIVQLAGMQATGAEEMPVGEAGAVAASQHGPIPGDAPASPTGSRAQIAPSPDVIEADVPASLQPDEPRASAKSLKKLDILVTRMRDAGLVSTRMLWLEAGYPTPIIDEERGEPRYGGEHGLRGRLSQRTVNRLIDWLQDLETQTSEDRRDDAENALLDEPEQVGLSIPAEVKKRMEDRG